MSRIVLVAGPDPGHALPVLGVARGLRARGHETTVATGTQHAAQVTAEGHRFLELPLLRSTPFDHDFGHVLWVRAGQMAPPLRALLAPLRPELLVVDTLTSVGGFVADLLGVPWVEVCPHHLTDPDPLVPPVGLGRAPSAGRMRQRSDAQIRRAQARSVAQGHELRDRARRAIGLGAPSDPVLRLLQTVPGLEPPRAAWPATAHVVGALAIDPDLPPLQPPPGDSPLVVVTDSTATGLPAPLGEAALIGLRGAGVRLVITTGRSGLVAWDGAVVGRAPHGPLLDLADVAVGPGGGGFTAKALVRAVPLVAIPLAGDQRETAARIRTSGAGRWLRPGRATPARLAATILDLLADPAAAAAARGLADGARGLGAERAATLVEAALAGAVPAATSASTVSMGAGP
jgi:UDP:flavonoid glycosyltransferase YjiC (YdhE family)